jgi:hypothetical protein
MVLRLCYEAVLADFRASVSDFSSFLVTLWGQCGPTDRDRGRLTSELLPQRQRRCNF